MRVLTIVHEDDAGPGVFSDVLAERGDQVEVWNVEKEPTPPAAATDYDAIMTFGGSAHPHQHEAYPWIRAEVRFLADALREKVPLLGVCLGAELIAHAEGTGTRRLLNPEIGWYDVRLTSVGVRDPLIGPFGESFEALQWHSFEVTLPSRATALAKGANCVQAFRVGKFAWGVQFHPEVTAKDFQHWLDTYTLDEDAVRVGIQPDAIADATAQRIATWQKLGRGLCERFLHVAAAR